MLPLNDPDIHRRTTPYVTMGLLAVNALVFLYQLTLNDLDQLIFTYRFGTVPAELTGKLELGLEGIGRGIVVDLASPIPTWATMFTSMFMHGGFLHLAGNMAFLWVFGDNIEDRFGHVRYLLFYLAAGVGAVWAQVMIDTDSVTPMVGASGAIAGILGAYLLLYPRNRISTLVLMGFIFVIRVPTAVLLGFWVLLQAFSGLGSLAAPSSAGSGVAYFAHLGGFAVGAATSGALLLLQRASQQFRPSRPPRFPPWPGEPPEGEP